MRMKNGNVITRTDEYRHKFSCAAAEVAYGWALEAGCDQESGASDGPTGWFARIGRRIVSEDEQGFVDITVFDDATQADEMFVAAEWAYTEWDDEREFFEDGTPRDREAALDLAKAYINYVMECHDVGCSALAPHMWGVHHTPKGPLG